MNLIIRQEELIKIKTVFQKLCKLFFNYVTSAVDGIGSVSILYKEAMSGWLETNCENNK